MTIAASPLLSVTIPPDPPSRLTVVSRYFDGFILNWTLPDADTNPNVIDYRYVVKVSDKSKEEHLEFATEGAVISIYELYPETKYNVTVCSEINNVTGCLSPLKFSTTGHACSNLLNVPLHAHIEGFSRTQGGQIIAHISCESGYRLVGESEVICNDTESHLPQCNLIICSVPPDSHANIVSGTNESKDGDKITLVCQNGYWIDDPNVVASTFSSTCLDGS